MESGEFEKDYVNLIKSRLDHADLFIDIGANIGYYVCIAASKGKNVIAFEPDTANCSLLYKNIHVNSYENLVEIHPIALADQPGLLEFYGIGTGASIVNLWKSKEDPVLVPVNVLDSLLTHRLEGKRSLFLVDVEGAESFVMKGAKQCLGYNAEWIVEIAFPKTEETKKRSREIFKIFNENGYSTFLLSDNLPVTSVELAALERGESKRLAKDNMFCFRKNISE